MLLSEQAMEGVWPLLCCPQDPDECSCTVCQRCCPMVLPLCHEVSLAYLVVVGLCTMLGTGGTGSCLKLWKPCDVWKGAGCNALASSFPERHSKA
jgi:hypothetical protein